MLTELYHDDYLQNKIPVIVYTDKQSLHDNLHLTKHVEEKRLRITLAGIQDSLERGNIKKILWISSKCQLADCLTKKGASRECLVYCLNYGNTENTVFMDVTEPEKHFIVKKNSKMDFVKMLPFEEKSNKELF